MEEILDRENLIPAPEIRNWTGPFNDEEYYFNLGKEQAHRIIEWLDIKPHERILDLGCGCGRIAIHFVDFLNDRGEYVGIDSKRELLNFCKENIENRDSRFRFEHVDAYNGSYSPDGRLKCKDITLPLEDESVDTVIMWSVFTHMFIEDIDSYLAEVHRVLRKKGRFITSFNLHNDLIRDRIINGKAHLDIRYKVDEYSYTLNREIPEKGFAHDEDRMKELYRKQRFLIREIRYGSWWTKDVKGEFHDCIIAQKL